MQCNFIKPCLARNIKDLPPSVLEKAEAKLWYGAIKLDGYYLQLQKAGDTIRMFTRDGNELLIPELAYMLSDEADFKGEFEYNYGCMGYMGDRASSAKLSPYVKAFPDQPKKTPKPLHEICLLNLLDGAIPKYGRKANMLTPEPRELSYWKQLLYSPELEEFEGLVVYAEDYVPIEGSRTNDKLKLKRPRFADCLVTAYSKGKGKYEGLIGKLLVQHKGDYFHVGTGLKDSQRSPADFEELRGRWIRVGYDHKSKDGKLIQPVIKEWLA